MAANSSSSSSFSRKRSLLGLAPPPTTTTMTVMGTSEPPPPAPPLLSSSSSPKRPRRAGDDHRVSTTQHIETTLLRAEVDHERSLRALDAKRFASTQQRLERHIQFAVEEATEAKTMMEEIRQQSENYVDQWRQKYQVLQESYHDLQYRLDCEGAESILSAPKEDERVQQLKEQLQHREQETTGLHQTIQDLQQELALVLSRTLVVTPSSPSDTTTNPVLLASPAPPQVLKELNATRLHLQETERENRQLQRSYDKLQTLNAELRRKQLEQSNDSTRVTHLQQQLDERDQALALAQAQVASWTEFGTALSHLLQAGAGTPTTTTTMTKKNPRVVGTHPPPPAGVPPELSVVQRYLQDATQEAREQHVQNQALESQLESADDKLQALQRTIRELEQSNNTLTSQLKDVQKQLQLSEGQVQVLQGQESVWKREVDALRSIVQTFDDLPLPGKTAAPEEASMAKWRMVQASADAAHDELKVLRQAKTALQSELDAALKAKSELQTKHQTVLDKFGKLREAVYAERTKAEKAEARAVQAEELAGKGSFNPETTRVVHMQTTPLTEALKQEVTVLRRQVEALSKTKKVLGGGTTTTTPGADVDPNKLHQRLKESFKEQIGRFREGVYLLTGYRIDMIPDGDRPTFKVRSMFAEQQDDHLLFQWPTTTPVESLDLLDTEWAKTLIMTTSSSSYEYVKRFGSLPAFLASTQLNLFEKQTMM